MNTPQCVGIIMDGNRRWAKAKGLPSLEGHRAGREALKRTVRFCGERSVKHLVVYGFSTENWNREPTEVNYLLNLFSSAIQEEITELAKEGSKVRFIGQRERFPSELQNAMHHAEKETQENEKITLWVCLSYGGRAEIVAAAKAATENGEAISEEVIEKRLWTAGMPDPDLVIRTGGEKRLSNFLTWQSIYSELFFTDTLWPDFSDQEFESILAEFKERNRRHGK